MNESVAETAITKRYEALLRVSQTLISIRSSEELFRILARELRAVVNFYVMGVGIYDEKAHEIHLTSYGEPGDPLQVPKFAPEETFTWWVYHHQQPLIIPSLDAETRFPAVAGMLKNRGVRSVCALPLTTVHRRLGGLAIGSTKTDAYSSEEVKFLSLLANQVALAVDDALNFDASQHAQEALRASERSLRLIVDVIPQFIAIIDAEGSVLYANQMLLEYTGWSLEDLKASDFPAMILHPDDFERLRDSRQKALAQGVSFELELRARRSDGQYRWFLIRYNPLRDQRETVLHWYASATDIDDRKKAEERLQLLLDVTNQLVSNLQLHDLLSAVSTSIRRVMHCDLVSICFPDSELKQLQTFVLDFPESKGFIRESFFIPIEGSLSGFVFRTRKPWIGSDSDMRQLGLLDEAAIPEGLKTGCILPLVSHNRILGVLSLARREEDAFSQADIEFLSQVANQIAIAVENTSAYHEITQAGTELEKALAEIKQRTEDLRRSESYLAEAQKLTHTGSWAWNVRTGALFWSQEIFRIYDFDPSTIGPTWEQFLQRVHPEDRPQIEQRAKMETTQKDWVDSQSDFRVLLPNGTIKRLHSVAHPVMDESGEITEVVGTVMDVTEHWNARTALEKALEEIQGLKDRLQHENLALR